MKLSALLMTGLPSLMVAVYTFHYGRWAAQQQLRRGATGLYLLAVVTLAVPIFTVWWTS